MKFFVVAVTSCFPMTASCFIAFERGNEQVSLLRLQRSYLDSLTKNATPSDESIKPLPHGHQSKSPSLDDPYAPGVAEANGLITSIDQDGFDSAADTVGPSIYGGSVQRDSNGSVIYSTQYLENDHHKPGPAYDGGGYSLMSRAIHVGPDKVTELLNDYPQLIEEASTGGATPLHVCGMSERGQHCTQTLVDAGADIHALDSYDYNALHRMASNDLEIGARVLVEAGVDPNGKVEGADSTPIEIARRQRAIKFLMCMQRLGHYD
eukprot:scaffold10584_cov23-Cyclotella_meneghiniana.AAC.3